MRSCFLIVTEITWLRLANSQRKTDSHFGLGPVTKIQICNCVYYSFNYKEQECQLPECHLRVIINNLLQFLIYLAILNSNQVNLFVETEV